MAIDEKISVSKVKIGVSVGLIRQSTSGGLIPIPIPVTPPVSRTSINSSPFNSKTLN